MMKNKGYTGIDAFRLIAAVLVITIHTSPLLDFSEAGDFILTRIVARVAVPFFFMTSGFFVVSRYSRDAKRLIGFVKKTMLIYGCAMLFYLPVNLYNGYFKSENLVPNIIQDIVFDGTFYHLWYLPASIAGAGLAWYLVKKLNYKKALAVTGALYFIGLFGDSYYGITEKNLVVNGFYQLLFQVSDYTRNGIFFVPVFFVLGSLLADSRRRLSLKKSLCGFTAGFALMLAEGLVLHHYDLQRHDSMYVFLLPCMYFLFSGLLSFRGKRRAYLSTASLILYIVHPMMIIAVRLFAKLFHLEELFIQNNVVHFLAVTAASVAFSMVVAVLWRVHECRNRKADYNPKTERAYIEIDLDNLEHNVAALQKEMQPHCRLMAVVKTGAYGHGAYEIATHLARLGVEAFAVATIDEGINLRKYGIRGEILILGYTNVQRASELKKYDLTQTLIDFEYANALNQQGITVKTHMKIDTGMHRLGLDCGDFEKIKEVFGMKYIKVCGMFTHLCCSDSLLPEDVSFTREQIARFYKVVGELEKSGISVPKLHMQSSYGLLNYPELKCDYVRAGIALYGCLSSTKDETLLKPDWRPVLSLKSRVILLRVVKAGESVGYGRCFTAERDSRIAIVPIGYGDGFPRSLSCGTGSAVIGKHKVPVIGRICMDQLAVDVTDVKEISVGDTVTLIGEGEDGELAAPVIADNLGSISNELLCRMGARLPIVLKPEVFS